MVKPVCSVALLLIAGAITDMVLAKANTTSHDDTKNQIRKLSEI
jgi:hypothetical protein